MTQTTNNQDFNSFLTEFNNEIKYELIIPTTGEVIEYRPFKVREEKVLLVANESGNQKQIDKAVKDTVKACTYGKVNIDNLTTVDLEYIFLKLRTNSIGETSKIVLQCKSCGTKNKVDIVLSDIEVEVNPELENSKKIEIDESITLIMKIPTLGDINKVNANSKDSDIETAFSLFGAAIEKIVKSDGRLWETKDLSPKALKEFIESLNSKQFNLLKEYVEKLPKLEKEIKFTCENENCEAPENTIVLRGLADFFG